MADATAHADPNWRGTGESRSGPIADGITLWRGCLAQVEGGYRNHYDGTGSDVGIVVNGDRRVERVDEYVGETSDPIPPEVQLLSGITLEELDVDGITAQTDVGAFVYGDGSDIADLTITDNATPPVGKVERFHGTDSVDVYIATPAERADWS